MNWSNAYDGNVAAMVRDAYENYNTVFYGAAG
jgi:hypothetical protein